MWCGKLKVIPVSIPAALDTILAGGDSKGELMRSNLPFNHPLAPLLGIESHPFVHKCLIVSMVLLIEGDLLLSSGRPRGEFKVL